LNHGYLSVPRSPRSMIPLNLAALLVSPNGGVTWFWPGVTIAVGLLVVCVIRPNPSGTLHPRRMRSGALLGLAAFVGYAIGLAYWSDPFGWYAWGPRLLMPAAGPLVALAVAVIAYGRFKPLLRSAWVWIALGLVAMAVLTPTLGNVFVVHTQDSMIYARYADYRPPHRCHTFGCSLIDEWRPKGNPLVGGLPINIARWQVPGGGPVYRLKVFNGGSLPLFWVAFTASAGSILIWSVYGRRSIDRGDWLTRRPPRRQVEGPTRSAREQLDAMRDEGRPAAYRG
jgi:hypothetical protein